MNTKKFVAVFAVLLMAFSAIAVVTVSVPESESAPLYDQGQVFLNVNGDYSKNASELSKLGITGPSGWQKVSDGYKIKMDGVNYKTRDYSAIVVAGNGVLTFDCSTVCNITCTGVDKTDITACIITANDDAKLCFTGGGVFNITHDNPDASISAAICAMFVAVKGCTLLANGSDVTPVGTVEPITTGIFIEEEGTLLVTDDALVVAKGGNVTTTGNFAGAISAGLYSEKPNSVNKLFVDGAAFCAIGGNIVGKDTSKVLSAGAVLNGDFVSNNGMTRFYSGSIDVGKADRAMSAALMLQGSIRADDSEIIAVSDDVYMTSPASQTTARALSAGVYTFDKENNAFNLEGCSCYFLAGSCTSQSTGADIMKASVGLYVNHQQDQKFTLSLKNCTVDIEGGASEKSYGLMGYDIEESSPCKTSEVNISDSEIWAYGKDEGLAGYIYVVAGTPIWSGISDDGKRWTDQDFTKEHQTSSKYVTIGFKPNAYLMSTEIGFTQVHSYRLDSNTFTLPECDFLAPEGKKFKCWSVDGVEYQPGETLSVEFYLVAEAVWEDAPGPGPAPSGDTTGVVIFAVIVALVAIAILLMIFVPAKK